MGYQFKLVSSLEKVFFHWPSEAREHHRGSMLKNEIHSFQLIGWLDGGEGPKTACTLKIESPLSSCITVYQVGYVPALVPSIRIGDDDDYLTKEPGLFPDPMYRIRNSKLELFHMQARAFWIAVEPQGTMIGTQPIVLKIYDDAGVLVGKLDYIVDIIDAELPQTGVRITDWFHGDCLAVLHNAEIMSEKYFALLDRYLAVYTKFGHNMILTPVFTPPLDTDVGAERPTNQLVDVSVSDGRFRFGFSRLKRWMTLCRCHGIEWFEISHLFTQWGAEHAPKIMAETESGYRKIFGWETDAASGEYRSFLEAFLPALVDFLKKEGLLEKCYFHISDEPSAEHAEQYKNARELMLRYVDEVHLMDALREFDLYEKGLFSTPVVCIDHIHEFIEKGATNLWTYYCMAQRKDVANRFMAMPSYRNRILGYQLYKNRIKGFLHWGFNFWFSERSRKVINPYADTCAGGGFQAGDSFVVYPLDEDGEVVCSTRLYVLNESFQDLRALELLESLTDRNTVESLLKEIDGFDRYPRENEFIVRLRERINGLIAENLSGR